MKRLLLILLVILALPTVMAVPEQGYCKIHGNIASYWLFNFEDSQSLCNLLNTFFGLNTEWFGFSAFSAASIENNADFCDGWAGECEVEDVTSTSGSSSGGSRSRNRVVAYPMPEEIEEDNEFYNIRPDIFSIFYISSSYLPIQKKRELTTSGIALFV